MEAMKSEKQIMKSENQVKKWVWIPCEKNMYKAGYIVDEENNRVKVQCDVLETVDISDVHKMNPSKYERADDLASLSYLNEPSVLHNLETRYCGKDIYTYSGLFLVAVNPYHSLNIYGDDIKKMIMKTRPRDGRPHIYGIANEAYQSMVEKGGNQSILITGESGAGKTENTKKVIEFLTFAVESNGEVRGFDIKQALISTNPILEAFGNAKTVRNDNSSRFGKFIQIKFKDSQISGAKIEKYLLEKSRVVGPSRGERNFHVFYYMLAGLSDLELEKLELTRNISDYACLNFEKKYKKEKIEHETYKNDLIEKIEKSNKTEKETISRKNEENLDRNKNKEEFQTLQKAFSEVGITDPLPFYRVVAVVMHLSNLYFIDRENDEGCVIADDAPLRRVSRLLGIPVNMLLEAILYVDIRAGRENVRQYRNAAQARAAVEGLMKMVYEVLFDALIGIINGRLDASEDSYIGILDIAGFEIFERNSFEQFCINYTNEKLQQYFNEHMFILEQEKYRSEEIKWDFINFGYDLQPTISLIESSYPIGILAYLDEECVMPKANDNTLLHKIRKINGVISKSFICKNKDNDKTFSIKHYAGEVEYDVSGWIGKNRDTEALALFTVIRKALSQIIQIDLADYKEVDYNGEKVNYYKANYNFIKKGAFKTVAQSHKESLNWLMRRLRETQPHFVRCILPNTNRKPDEFNRQIVLDQLRCNGVLEGIRISRLGYPSRMLFSEFNSRYAILVEEFTDAEQPTATGGVITRDETINIVRALRISENDFRIGRTMVFFRQGIVADLEDLRDEKIFNVASTIRALLRKKVLKKRVSLDADRLAAVKMLQRNAIHCLSLLRSRWWSLFLKIQPLLDVEKTENEKRRLENELAKLKVELERANTAIADKARAVSELELVVTNLRNENARREAENSETVDLVERLKSENAAIISMEREAKERIAEIEELRGEVERLRICEDKHSARHSELERIISEQRAALVTRNEAVVAELQAANERLREEKSALEGENKALTFANEKVMGEVMKITEENNNLRKEKDVVASDSARVIDKLRNDIEDLQIGNENKERAIANLEQELNYQRERNNKLQKLFEDLKQIREKEGSNSVKLKNVNEEAETSASLSSAVTKLKNKIKSYEKLLEDLRHEKEALYNENLSLTQNKLDEIFTNEAEFNRTKTLLQSEISRLETENKNLRAELTALSQTMSDGSEEGGYERLVMVIDEERRQRIDITKQLVEHEKTNLKLINELRVEREKKVVATFDTTGVSHTVAKLEREIDLVRKMLKKASEAFLSKLFSFIKEKDAEYAALHERWITQRGELMRAEATITSLRAEVAEKSEQAATARAEVQRLRNENEGMAVAQKTGAVTISELRKHIVGLEEAFVEREEEIVEIKRKYEAAAGRYAVAVREYETRCDEMRQKIINFDWSKFDAEITKIRDAHNARVQRLTARVNELLEQNENLEVENHKKAVEIRNLTMCLEDLRAPHPSVCCISKSSEIKSDLSESSNGNTSIYKLACANNKSLDNNSMNDNNVSTNSTCDNNCCDNNNKLVLSPEHELVRERVVSTFIVDKEALKAAEWKKIVSEKCNDVSDNLVISQDNTLRETIKEKDMEIELLGLKLRQAERMLNDNNKIVETMKLCLSVIHKK